jgi:hypothetical protein
VNCTSLVTRIPTWTRTVWTSAAALAQKTNDVDDTPGPSGTNRYATTSPVNQQMLKMICIAGNVVGLCSDLVCEGFQVCAACYVRTFAHRTAWFEFVAFLCSKSKSDDWKALFFELHARYRKMEASTREEMTKMDLKLTKSEFLLTAERERNTFLLSKGRNVSARAALGKFQTRV